MSEPANDPVEAQLGAETFLTPLQEMALEIHEIYEELKAVGIPSDDLTKIIAHMVTETVLFRSEYYVEDDEEDEDDLEDDDPDERIS